MPPGHVGGCHITQPQESGLVSTLRQAPWHNLQASARPTNFPLPWILPPGVGVALCPHDECTEEAQGPMIYVGKDQRWTCGARLRKGHQPAQWHTRPPTHPTLIQHVQLPQRGTPGPGSGLDLGTLRIEHVFFAFDAAPAGGTRPVAGGGADLLDLLVHSLLIHLDSRSISTERGGRGVEWGGEEILATRVDLNIHQLIFLFLLNLGALFLFSFLFHFFADF